MTRVPSLAAALGAALALGACAGEGGQLATSPEAPAFQMEGVGPACNLTNLRKATSALFGSKDPANAVAKQFTSKNQNSEAVLPFAYNLFSFIEAKRATTSWVSEDVAKGAELTIQIIACSPVDYTDDGLEGTGNLEFARDAFIGALMPGGTYAVRGSVPGELPIVSQNLQKGLSAPGDFFTWFGAEGKRSLIIGYTIDPNEFSSEDEAGVYYDWSMVRPALGSNALSGLATISYCVGDEFLPVLNELRIQHHPSTQDGTVLPKGNAVTGVNCLTGVPVGLQPAGFGSFAARLFRGLVDAIRPAPLHASAFVKGPVSGTLGDFSPTGVVDPDTTLITFATLPTGGTTNTDLPLAVLVTAEGGTPWAGITVRITASANNGATLAPCGNEAVTNDDGLAIFEDFQINSPGTVKLTAATIETPQGIDGDYDEVSLESTSFVITGAGNEEGCPVTAP